MAMSPLAISGKGPCPAACELNVIEISATATQALIRVIVCLLPDFKVVSDLEWPQIVHMHFCNLIGKQCQEFGASKPWKK
jgi:hypothetical protein